MVNKTVHSFKELKEELERFRSILIESAQTQSLASAHRLLELSMNICPQDTGTLANSGRLETGGVGKHLLLFGGGKYINPKTGLPCLYARMVHDGTSKMPARPFIKWAQLMLKGSWSKSLVDMVEAKYG